ncbi:MAG: hypothetical protein V4562_09670 [Pseudomonadota bacterium]
MSAFYSHSAETVMRAVSAIFQNFLNPLRTFQMNKLLVLATLVGAVALSACGKKAEAPAPAPAPVAAPAPAPADAASMAASGAAMAASGAEMAASGAAMAASAASAAK